MNRTCDQCLTPIDMSRPNRRFCNDRCRSRWNRANGPMTSVVCEGCNQPFPTTNKRARFCTKSCAATLHNRGRKVAKRCTECSVEFSGPGIQCANGCRHVVKARARLERWLAGETDASGKNGALLSWARKYLLAEAGHACPECGWCTPNPYIDKVILTVNHIDGDWTNNYRSNLEVLCYNCHTLTPTFGALNKGSVSGRRPATPKR